MIDPLETLGPGDEPRSIPRNDDAERALLGAMLLSATGRREVLTQTGLTADDFFHTGHGLVWDAIVRLDADGSPVDATSVLSELIRTNQLREVGGATAIHDLLAAVPAPSAALTYATAVSSAALFRRIVIAGHRVAEIGYAMGDPGEAAATSSALIETAVEGAAGRGPMPTMASRVESLIEDLDSSSPDLGIAWPWRDLDAVLNPIMPGQLILFGARPGGGKSIVGATGFGVEVARRGVPILEMTIEMSAKDYTARKLSHLSRVPLTKIKRRDLSAHDWEDIAKASGTVSDLPVATDETEVVTVEYVRAAIRRGIPGPDGTPVRPRIVVVDYAQLMASTGRHESRQIEMASVSRGLRRLAKAEQVAIVALVQLNRGPEGRADKVPVMSDIRDTGQFENDADLVILLHRPDMYEKEGPRMGEVDLIVAKNRDGWTGTVTLAFLGHYASMRDMADDDVWGKQS